MGKIRVYELAKEMGLENQECVKRLMAAGFTVKSHSSTVDEEDARRALARPPEKKVEEKKAVRTVLRRRKDEVAPEEGALETMPAAPEMTPAPEAAVSADVETFVPAPAHEPEPAAADAAVAATAPASAVAPGESAVAEPQAVAATPPPPPDARPRPTARTEVVPPPRTLRPGERPRPGMVGAPRGDGQGARAGAAPAAPGAPGSPDQVSRVVRVIDADAIKARLAAEGRDFGGRRPAGDGRFRQVRDIRVVHDQSGRGGPQLVDVTQARGALPGSAPPSGGKPGKGKKGKAGEPEDRRDLLEMRAGARDLWVTPGKKRKGNKRGQETQVTTPAAHKRVIEVPGTITVGELARQMAVKVGDVIRKLMSMGMMVTMNQTIDFDTAALIAQEFEFEVKNVEFQEADLFKEEAQVSEGGEKLGRPPVVTIMGHVDHGKTSLLDAIRSANVAGGEAGGITQHIGAYSVAVPGKEGSITFLDTPGHEAFTAMRARGAKITDIVVLVVAADDGVMPQTLEAVNHAKAAGVPIIVAVNKVDKPDANPDRVMQQLAEQNLVPEAWGGKTMYVPVSAKKKTGIKELLEGLLLQSEVMELSAPRSSRAKGTIVEAQLDKGRGPVATVLVQEGTLRLGDHVVAGDFFGRVRQMYDDRGNVVSEAAPSTPVAVLGLNGVPNAGDHFDALADADTAKTIATHRAAKTREQELAQTSRVSLENFLQGKSKDAAKELKLIIKADVQGSVEAVSAALVRLSNPQVKVSIVHNGVGAVTESDVNLAAASQAVIIGFGVRPDPKALAHAEQHHVEIRTYTIIYEAAAEVRAAMEGLLAPTVREKYLGRAEVRQVFQVTKVGQIAGCQVTDGKLLRTGRLRLLRDSKQVFDGKVGSLRRFKDDVREVVQGFECGVSIEGFNDIKAGDILEAYEMEVTRTKLEGVPDPAAPFKPAGGGEARA